MLTVTVALQALNPILEEEGSRILWRQRVLRCASDFCVENVRSTESQLCQFRIDARKLARQNLISQGVGSAFHTRWGDSCRVGMSAERISAFGRHGGATILRVRTLPQERGPAHQNGLRFVDSRRKGGRSGIQVAPRVRVCKKP